MQRPIVSAVLSAGLIGCGGSEPQSPPAKSGQTAVGAPTATQTPTATARDSAARVADAANVLDSWSAVILPALVTAQARAGALQKGETDKAARLERKFYRQLKTVQRFRRDARERLGAESGTREAKAVGAAGDAWSEWAREIRTHPPAGDVSQAQKITDLGRTAVRRHQAAYEAVGRQPPPAFQRK